MALERAGSSSFAQRQKDAVPRNADEDGLTADDASQQGPHDAGVSPSLDESSSIAADHASKSVSDTPWDSFQLSNLELYRSQLQVDTARQDKRYLEAAKFHKNVIRIRKRLASYRPITKNEIVLLNERQIDELLRFATPDDVEPDLLPPDVDELESGTIQPEDPTILGRFFAKWGTFHMRSSNRPTLEKAAGYFGRSLLALANSKAADASMLVEGAQNLADIHCVLDEPDRIQSLLTWLGTLPSTHLIDKISPYRINSALQWSESQGFDAARFDELDSRKGSTPLQHAVRIGDVQQLEVMFSFTERSIPPDRCADLASTLLLQSADVGNVEITKFLIAHHAHGDVVDEDSRSVFHHCVNSPRHNTLKSLETAQCLVDAGVRQLNRQDSEGKTALYIACEQGDVSMVELLLRHGARAEVPEIHGKTALYTACESGNLSVIKSLLNDARDLDVNATGPGGYTPLIVAVRAAATNFRRVDVVKELVKHDADPSIKDSSGKDAFSYVAGLKAADLRRILKSTTPRPASRRMSASRMSIPSQRSSLTISTSEVASSSRSSIFAQSLFSQPVSNRSSRTSLSSIAHMGLNNAQNANPSALPKPSRIKFPLGTPRHSQDRAAANPQPGRAPLPQLPELKSTGNDDASSKEGFPPDKGSAETPGAPNPQRNRHDSESTVVDTTRLNDEMSNLNLQPQESGGIQVRPHGESSGSGGYLTPMSWSTSSNPSQPSGQPNSSGWRESQSPNEQQGSMLDTAAQNTSTSGAPGPLFYACPYAKVYPSEYFKCNRYVMKQINRVKQHLREHHLEQLDADTRQAFIQSLREKVPRSMNDHEQWFYVFNIVFPGAPRPHLPFADFFQNDRHTMTRDVRVKFIEKLVKLEYIDSEYAGSLEATDKDMMVYEQQFSQQNSQQFLPSPPGSEPDRAPLDPAGFPVWNNMGSQITEDFDFDVLDEMGQMNNMLGNPANQPSPNQSLGLNNPPMLWDGTPDPGMSGDLLGGPPWDQLLNDMPGSAVPLPAEVTDPDAMAFFQSTNYGQQHLASNFMHTTGRDFQQHGAHDHQHSGNRHM